METGNRNMVNIKIAVENANLCGGEICDVRTLMKYAKNRQYVKYESHSHI